MQLKRYNEAQRFESCCCASLMPITVALVRGAPNADAGKRLVDYLLAKDAEARLVSADAVFYPTRGDTDTSGDAAAGSRQCARELRAARGSASTNAENGGSGMVSTRNSLAVISEPVLRRTGVRAEPLGSRLGYLPRTAPTFARARMP